MHSETANSIELKTQKTREPLGADFKRKKRRRPTLISEIGSFPANAKRPLLETAFSRIVQADSDRFA
jgi:hypothetical protein